LGTNNRPVSIGPTAGITRPKSASRVKEASQDMTTKEGRLTWAAKQEIGKANSVEANERRRRRQPPSIDWDKAWANLLDMLGDDDT
jgi:hypothetical protein